MKRFFLLVLLAALADSAVAQVEDPASKDPFYHLGNQQYRVIKLNAGMPLEAAAGAVCINWDSDGAAQRWTAKNVGEKFVFINQASGEALAQAGDAVVTRKPDEASAPQRWTLIEAATIPR